jgi:hypothetical protein
MKYYEYRHIPGYGRADHMADELIARAARQLGYTEAQGYIAAACGFASHPVPQGSCTVRLPVARGTAARMRGALRRARREFLRDPDCWIAVAKV